MADIDRDIDDAAINRLAFLSGQTRDHLLRWTMRPDVEPDPWDKRQKVQQALLKHGDLLSGLFEERADPIPAPRLAVLP